MEKSKQELKEENIKKILNKLPYLICTLGVLVIIIRALVVDGEQSSVENLVKIGNIESTYITEAIIVKDENVIVRDTSKNYISTISSGERVSNNAIIATYKTQEYEEYIEKLEQMDNEILELMKNLPMVYSSETQTLIKEINSFVKTGFGSTSYLDMQLTLNLCNEILTQKADIIANSSKSGDLIKDLIEQRNGYVENAKNTNDNIIATRAGVVSYQTDNLENIFVIEDVDNYSYSYLKDKLEDIKHTGNIKIVNNYEAYIFLQVPIEYDKYLVEDKSYNLEIIDVGDYIYRAKLVNSQMDEETGKLDIMLSINSGIENIINVRDCQVEITWWADSGMYVPVSALSKYDDKDAYYVQIIKYGKAIQVPVVVKNNNGVYAVIDNYETSEMEQLGLTREYKLQVYDRLVIN